MSPSANAGSKFGAMGVSFGEWRSLLGSALWTSSIGEWGVSWVGSRMSLWGVSFGKWALFFRSAVCFPEVVNQKG